MDMARFFAHPGLEAGGRAWLAAFPCKPLGLWIAPAEFVVATRLYLGVTSRTEDRALLRQGVDVYGRHHALRDHVQQAVERGHHV